jgi:carbon-monoxide dehydrogenase large subunit
VSRRGDKDAKASVGTPVPRREDRPLLRGEGEYIADVEAPAGTLHAAFVRSPAAHAELRGVDLGAALEAPGVRGAFAFADLGLASLTPPMENPDARTVPRPLLADDRVRFVGEPLAVVVADSPYLAEDAAELVGFELESLPPVVDPVAACEPGGTLLFEETNVLYDSRFEKGEVDAAFEAAAVVVERKFRNPRYSPAPMEGRGALAIPEADGVLVWTSSQAPHRLAEVTAALLGLEPDTVRVRCADVGGAFGQKCHAYPEEILVAWLARRLGRPVRWIEDRAENLLAAAHARDQALSLRVAADADGKLLAIDADVICDQGAYGVFPHGHILEALGTPAIIPGSYRLDAYRFRSRSVATNKSPEGAYRGVGLPVSAFVHERLMDILAGELDLDPAEIRRRNLLRPADMPHLTLTNQRYDSGDYPAALEAALDKFGYEEMRGEVEAMRAAGRQVGIGISSYVEYTAINSKVFQGRGMTGIPGCDGAHIAVELDGRLGVWTTLPAIGQGTDTTFAQLVADAFATSPDEVDVHRSDTGVGQLHGTGTFASRSAVAGAGAIGRAAAELKERLRADAAPLLKVPPEELEIAAGQVRVRGVEDDAIALAELVADRPPERYRVSAEFDPPNLAYPYATHVCMVEVDAEIGGLEILRWVIVEDCGKVINPIIVEGQIHGATAQGIGGTTLEQLVYDESGQLLTSSFMDYLLPTASDIPNFEVGHLETPAPGEHGGAKGVGEGGTLAPPGAIANAVSDALGREFNQLPLAPESLRTPAPSAQVA